MLNRETTPLLLHATSARQTKTHIEEESPGVTANLLSKITFSWVGAILQRGVAKPLDTEDLWGLESADEALHVAKELRQAAEADQLSESIQLWLAIRKAFGFNMYLAGVWKLTGDMLGFVGPICVNALIKYVEDPASAWFSKRYYGYFISCALFLSTTFQTLCLHQHHHLVIREAIRARSALTMLVFHKALMLSSQTKSALGSGRILNLATIDANRILDLFYMVHYSWAAPLQLVIGLVLLLQYLGVASLAGIAVMIVLLPISAFFSSKAASISRNLLDYTDKRLKLLSELLQHIRVVKFYAWEPPMLSQIETIRHKELRFLKRMVIWNAMSQVALQGGPVLISMASFAVYSWVQKEQLTADKAFTAIMLFNILSMPLRSLPRVFSLIFQAQVSVTRLETFLATENRKPQPMALKLSLSPRDREFLGIRHATFKWTTNDQPSTAKATHTKNELFDLAVLTAPPPVDPATHISSQLTNVSVTIPKGQLTLIIGAVGSGKSTLLAALMGELEPECGTIHMPTTNIAYAAQRPYLINGTLQDNITFGAPYEFSRLHQVLEKCELLADVEQLPMGLQTEIGENGATLSGGQRQRVAIARAIYTRQQELYVFDDSLSALDAQVASRIFDQCFNESTRGMLAGKTRIFSTHSLQFAPSAQWIIVMDQMRVVQMGTFAELITEQPQGKFAQMLKTVHQASASSDSTGNSPQISTVSHEENGGEKSQKGKLIEDETKIEGMLSWQVYSSYLSSCGLVLVLGASWLLVGTQLASVSTDLWLMRWTTEAPTGADVIVFLSVYAYLGIITIVLGFCGDLCCRFAGLRASYVIHRKLLRHVIKGTMRFFDTTPVGRILNRFSNDMNTIDQKLNTSVVAFITMLLSLLSMLAVQSSVAPSLLALFVPVFICYVSYQQYYAKSCRELQRLDNISKSPVYAHFTQMLNGLVTIRAFQRVEASERDQAQRINENTKAFLLLNLINRWLGVRLEFLGAIITLAVALFVSWDRLVISSAMAGLLLSYSQNMTLMLNWIVRNNIDMENMLNSIERTDEYCRIPTEHVALSERTYHDDEDVMGHTNATIDVLETRPQWPEEGVIRFTNVVAQYSPQSPVVLNNLSFEIAGGEKVGICGRTGAGKSSLLLALFRIVECTSGQIMIDGVNIADLELRTLRSRMAIIPQDPVLFAATLRFNLDPTGEASDVRIWDALRKAHLYQKISALPHGLQAPVLENGENFSVGERQLICLARALLRNTKILCVDEATASVDYAMDALIQQSIRTEFPQATVLTIAHRIETILDYDKILVLKDGHVAEFGPPVELRSNEEGDLFDAVV